jgi:hypothetical protein
VLGPALAAAQPEPSGVAVELAARRFGRRLSCTRTEQVLILSVVEGRLSDSVARVELIPMAPGRFKYRGSQRTLRVLPGQSGAPRLLIEAPNTRGRIPRGAPDAVGSQHLARYAGRYPSPSSPPPLRLTAHGDTLRLERDAGPDSAPAALSGRFLRGRRGPDPL